MLHGALGLAAGPPPALATRQGGTLVRVRLRPSAILLALLITSALVVLRALGTWQLARLRQASANNTRFEAREAAPPLEWAEARELPPTEAAGRRVRITGRWDNARTVMLVNRARYDRRGIDVVTPLQPDGGGPVLLVNRGWIGETEVDRVLPELLAQPTGTVEGLARYPILPPGQELSPGRWTRLDAEEMGKTLPYPVVAWHLAQGRREVPADERNMGTFPVQRYQVQRDDIPHMDYMLTWYGLAGALTATVVIRIRSQRARTTGATAASIP